MKAGPTWLPLIPSSLGPTQLQPGQAQPFPAPGGADEAPGQGVSPLGGSRDQQRKHPPSWETGSPPDPCRKDSDNLPQEEGASVMCRTWGALSSANASASIVSGQFLEINL